MCQINAGSHWQCAAKSWKTYYYLVIIHIPLAVEGLLMVWP